MHRCLTFPIVVNVKTQISVRTQSKERRKLLIDKGTHEEYEQVNDVFLNEGKLPVRYPNACIWQGDLDSLLLINCLVAWIPLCSDSVICWRYSFVLSPGKLRYKFPSNFSGVKHKWHSEHSIVCTEEQWDILVELQIWTYTYNALIKTYFNLFIKQFFIHDYIIDK